MNTIKIVKIKIVAILFVIVLAGCSSLPQFTSERCPRKIHLIGDLNEWRDISAYVDKNNVIAVSVCHDDEFAYVCLTTDDPQTQRQIMAGGLTVWFDPSGSDDKTFGVNFPLPRNGPGPRRGVNSDMKDTNVNQQLADQSLLEMEVVGQKENERYRLPVINTEGIAAHIERSKDGIMVYELQVPIRKTPTRPNAIEPKKDFVGLGFETGTVQGGAERVRGEQGGRSGGYGGADSPPGGGMGYGRHGGGGGGRGRGQSGSSSVSAKAPEPIKTWWKVKL